jgi:archaellum component FlaC
MVTRNRDDEQDAAIEELMEEVNHNRRKTDSPWSFTPQVASLLLAVATVLMGAFWTVSDFRVTMSDQSTRITMLSQRITDFERKLNDIDLGGTRGSIATDAVVKNLQKQIDDLENSTQSLSNALVQHNRVMDELVKKERAK